MSAHGRSVGRLRALRLVSGALGVALVAGAWASTASAQDAPADRIVLRAVDATDTASVTAIYGWSGDPETGVAIEVTENGEVVDATVVPSPDIGRSNDIVFVLDTSGSTDRNAFLTNASEAVAGWVNSLPPGHRASVVVAGASTARVVGLSSDATRLAGAALSQTPNGDGALLSGIVRGATSVARVENSITTVVVLTDGVADSPVSSDQATGAVNAIGGALYVVGLQAGGLDEGLFGGMANATGGRMVLTEDPEQIGAALENIRPEVDQQLAATWASSETAGIQDVSVSSDGVAATGSYISGSELVGSRNLVPRPPVEPSGISFFHNDLGKYLGFGAAAAACVLFAYGVVSLFVRDNSLTTQLQPYGEGFVAKSEFDDDQDEQPSGAFAQTAFLQRAVAMTEGFAQRQGFLTRIEKMLEKADVPLRAGEAMFIYAAAVVLGFVLGLAILQNLIGTVIVVLIAALIPPSIVNFLATRKKKAFESLLPDTLQLMSSTLRAGYSMMQGLEAVSVEAAEPMGKELRRVVTEARLGRPLEESLETVAQRMESADFAWAVMAIRIQREVGGNLAELLETVGETMTERERLRRDINSLTAEGRMSAYVLIALPIGMLGFLYTANRDYMEVLFERTIGQILLAAGLLLMVGGYLWMRKIIKIEV